MQTVGDQCRAAIPEQVYNVIQGFIDYYLEKDLLGEIVFTKKERGNIDLSKFESTKECPNPDVGEYHVAWFKLKTMYDAIAFNFIQPLFDIQN